MVANNRTDEAPQPIGAQSSADDMETASQTETGLTGSKNQSVIECAPVQSLTEPDLLRAADHVTAVSAPVSANQEPAGSPKEKKVHRVVLTGGEFM